MNRSTLLLATALSSSVLATVLPIQALTVIHDAGGTQPIAPYLAPLSGQPEAAPARPAQPDSPRLPTTTDLLPIRTPELQPGPLAGFVLRADLRERLRFLTVPVFVVGSDPLSLAWLRRHRERLARLGAVGLLIQAETEADLAAVAMAGQGLRIAPVPGAELAHVLGLVRYPLLISAGGVEQ